MGLILLILVCFLVFGGGGYYIAPENYGPHFASGGVGLVLFVLLVLFLLGIIGGPRS